MLRYPLDYMIAVVLILLFTHVPFVTAAYTERVEHLLDSVTSTPRYTSRNESVLVFGTRESRKLFFATVLGDTSHNANSDTFPVEVEDDEDNLHFYSVPGITKPREYPEDVAVTYSSQQILEHLNFLKAILVVGNEELLNTGEVNSFFLSYSNLSVHEKLEPDLGLIILNEQGNLTPEEIGKVLDNVEHGSRSKQVVLNTQNSKGGNKKKKRNKKKKFRLFVKTLNDIPSNSIKFGRLLQEKSLTKLSTDIMAVHEELEMLMNSSLTLWLHSMQDIVSKVSGIRKALQSSEKHWNAVHHIISPTTLAEALDQVGINPGATASIKQLAKLLEGLQAILPANEGEEIGVKFKQSYETKGKYIKEFSEWHHTWFKFLVELYEALSAPGIQKRKHLYNVSNLANWGLGEKDLSSKGLAILDDGNIGDICDTLEKTILPKCINNVEQHLTPDRLQEINNVLEETIRSSVENYCLENVRVITGYTVSVSNHTNLQSCGSNEVVILASSKLLFLGKVEVPASVSLYAVSPSVEAETGATLSLSGKENKHYPMVHYKWVDCWNEMDDGKGRGFKGWMCHLGTGKKGQIPTCYFEGTCPTHMVKDTYEYKVAVGCDSPCRTRLGLEHKAEERTACYNHRHGVASPLDGLEGERGGNLFLFYEKKKGSQNLAVHMRGGRGGPGIPQESVWCKDESDGQGGMGGLPGILMDLKFSPANGNPVVHPDYSRGPTGMKGDEIVLNPHLPSLYQEPGSENTKISELANITLLLAKLVAKTPSLVEPDLRKELILNLTTHPAIIDSLTQNELVNIILSIIKDEVDLPEGLKNIILKSLQTALYKRMESRTYKEPKVTCDETSSKCTMTQNPAHEEIAEKDTIISSYIDSLVESYLLINDKEADDTFVTDLDLFLSYVSDQLKSYREHKKKDALKSTMEFYKGSLDAKAAEANEAVSKTLKTELSETFRLINEEMDQIVQEIMKKSKEVLKTKNETQETRGKLRQLGLVRLACKAVNSASDLVGAVPLVGNALKQASVKVSQWLSIKKDKMDPHPTISKVKDGLNDALPKLTQLVKDVWVDKEVVGYMKILVKDSDVLGTTTEVEESVTEEIKSYGESFIQISKEQEPPRAREYVMADLLKAAERITSSGVGGPIAREIGNLTKTLKTAAYNLEPTLKLLRAKDAEMKGFVESLKQKALKVSDKHQSKELKALIQHSDLFLDLVKGNRITIVSAAQFMLTKITKSMRRIKVVKNGSTTSAKVTQFFSTVEHVKETVTKNLTSIMNSKYFPASLLENADDVNEINQVSNQLDENADLLDELDYVVNTALMGMKRFLSTTVERIVSSDGKNMSSAQDTMQSHDFSNALQSLKFQLARIQASLNIQASANINHIFDKLEYTMKNLFQVQGKVSKYYEEEKFAEFMYNIASQGESNSLDESPKLAEIRHLTEANTIKWFHVKCSSAFLQWSFPFAKYYRNAVFMNTLANGTTNITQLYQRVSDGISLMREAVKKDKALISKRKDSRLMYSRFYDGADTLPFYIWRYEEHKLDVSLLLGGNKVIFITSLDRKKFAVKFNMIDVMFVPRTEDEKLAKEFHEAMTHMEIEIHHMGENRYFVGDSEYLITTPGLLLKFSFAKRNDGSNTPMSYNSNWKKIRDGDILLSPYATWTLQLVPGAKGDIKELKKFVGMPIDIHLCGDGSYLDSEVDWKDLDLDRYYLKSVGK